MDSNTTVFLALLSFLCASAIGEEHASTENIFYQARKGGAEEFARLQELEATKVSAPSVAVVDAFRAVMNGTGRVLINSNVYQDSSRQDVAVVLTREAASEMDGMSCAQALDFLCAQAGCVWTIDLFRTSEGMLPIVVISRSKEKEQGAVR